MPTIHVIHGPNLALLGEREPDIYGRTTLAELDAEIKTRATAAGFLLRSVCSNHEGALIDALHSARHDAGVLLNAGAYAHTSLAVADAVRAIAPVPVVEVHLSNTVARERERRRALVGAACWARVEGFGTGSYHVALAGLIAHLRAS